MRSEKSLGEGSKPGRSGASEKASHLRKEDWDISRRVYGRETGAQFCRFWKVLRNLVVSQRFAGAV